MTEIEKVKTYEKAVKVIESCTSETQLKYAQKYMELYYQIVKDFDNFRKLVNIYNDTVDKLQSR